MTRLIESKTEVSGWLIKSGVTDQITILEEGLNCKNSFYNYSKPNSQARARVQNPKSKVQSPNHNFMSS